MLNDEAIALLALTPNRREVPLLRHLEHDIDLAAAASNPARKSKGKSSSTAGIERTLNRPVDDHLALLTTWPSCTMNDFKGRHFEGEIVLWAVRW